MKPVTIKCLLDSGAAETLVLEKYCKKLKLKDTKGKTTTWSTPGGTLTTSKKCKATFSMPELHDDKLIEWEMHVTKDLGT
jgi:Aspartyl protease